MAWLWPGSLQLRRELLGSVGARPAQTDGQGVARKGGSAPPSEWTPPPTREARRPAAESEAQRRPRQSPAAAAGKERRGPSPPDPRKCPVPATPAPCRPSFSRAPGDVARAGWAPLEPGGRRLSGRIVRRISVALKPFPR